MFMTQGRPFNLGDDPTAPVVAVDPAVVPAVTVDPVTVDPATAAKVNADVKELQTVLPSIPGKIGLGAVVWIGLIYWFLIRR